MNFINHIAAKACESYLSLKPTTNTLPIATKGKKYLLYVHIPFCHTLCTYCTFNRFLFDETQARRYFVSLREEMRLVHALGYEFDSMYIGGGTTTVLVDELLETIELAKKLFDIKQVSCESDPNGLTVEFVRDLKRVVDRYSVGVQSFDDNILRQMGRYDKFGSGEQTAKRLMDIAGEFAMLNVDMIFNFPSQTMDMLHNDIKTLKSISPSQISYYPLMSSPSVKSLLKRSMGEVSLGNEKRFYYEIVDSLGVDYDMLSSWAFGKHGSDIFDEYVIDHDEYVGIGSGSFSFLEGTLYVNTFSLKKYSQVIATGHLATQRSRSYPKRAQMWYRMMVELFGGKLDIKEFNAKFDTNIALSMFAEISYLKLTGMIKEQNGYLVSTYSGMYLFTSLMKEFYIGMDYVRESSRAALNEEDIR
jgi:menaquinone C8-methyltransferase